MLCVCEAIPIFSSSVHWQTWKKWPPSRNQHNESPELGFKILSSTKRKQGSLEKGQILDFGQGTREMNLRYLALPENVSKRHRSLPEGVPSCCPPGNNVNIKRNNSVYWIKYEYTDLYWKIFLIVECQLINAGRMLEIEHHSLTTTDSGRSCRWTLRLVGRGLIRERIWK